jgi:hypothetical protein
MGAAMYRLNNDRFPIPSASGMKKPAIATMGRRYSMVEPIDLKVTCFKVYISKRLS